MLYPSDVDTLNDASKIFSNVWKPGSLSTAEPWDGFSEKRNAPAKDLDVLERLSQLTTMQDVAYNGKES
jgi:hypothetical protein